MKALIEKTIGKSKLTFEVEGAKELDMLTRVSGFTAMPDVCSLCKSTDVELISNKADTYSFVKVKCNKCTATSTMGQYKDESGVFWKEFEIYQKEPSEK